MDTENISNPSTGQESTIKVVDREGKEENLIKSSHKKIKISLALALTLFVFSLILFLLVLLPIMDKKQEDVINSPEIENTEKPKTENKEEKSSLECNTCIYYVKEGDLSNVSTDDTVWQLNTLTNEKKELNIEQEPNSSIYNLRFPYGGKYIVYGKGDNIWMFELNTGTEKIISPSLPEKIMGHYYLSRPSISPNGKYVTYGVDYADLSEECGDGPCPEVDLYPNIKAGHYSYNIESGQTVYLGNLLTITAWTPDSRYVYTSNGFDYHEYILSKGTYKIDVATGKTELLEEHSTNIGNDYLKTILPIPAGGYVLLEGGTSSTSILGSVTKDGNSIVLDTGNWSEIQPHFEPNLDYSLVLYQRVGEWGDGSPLFNLNKIDTNTYAIETVYEQKGRSGFSRFLTWKDKNTFIMIESDYSLESGVVRKRIIEVNIENKEQKVLVDYDEGIVVS